MNTSVGTKAKKKQPSLSQKPPSKAQQVSISAEFKTSLLSLENACTRILDGYYTEERQDTERMYWQQRLMNIAKPVSLALAECTGPRHFHGHYRHRKDDESVLQPVLENPLDALAQVCQQALKACRGKLVGIQDDSLLKARTMLENALQGFVARYMGTKMEAD